MARQARPLLAVRGEGYRISPDRSGEDEGGDGVGEARDAAIATPLDRYVPLAWARARASSSDNVTAGSPATMALA